MKKRIVSILLCLLMAFSTVPAGALAQETPPADYGTPGVDYAESQAIVCVEGGLQNLTGSQRSRNASDFQIVESLMTVSDEKAEAGLLRSRAAAPESRREIVLVQSGSGEGTQALIESLKANPSVLFAEPNYRVQANVDETALSEEETAATSAVPSPEAPETTVKTENPPGSGAETQDTTETPQSDTAGKTPDNAVAEDQETTREPEPITVQAAAEPVVQDMEKGLWSMDNRGQMGGISGTDINTKPVWKAGNTGSKKVAVAVLDSGIDYTHADLAGQMWDENETGVSIAGIEGGGAYGKNVCTGYSDPTDPMDDMLHGTHCAGTIGAAWNYQGVYGVCEDLQLIAVKALNGAGSGFSSDMIKGYDYLSAVCDVLEGRDTQLKAINNSWAMPSYSEALDTAITQLGKKGVVSVFAAGNSNTNVDLETNTSSGQLQKAYTVVVGAMNSDGTRALFSSYGKQKVDVFAPGTSILSTMPGEKAAYMAPFADERANYIYDGYEGQRPGATDKKAQNGGLPLYYYSDSAQNHVGEAVANGEDGKAMLGNGCLQTNEIAAGETVTLISEPINISTGADAPRAYFSFGAQNIKASTSKITVSYVGEDGTEIKCPVADGVTQAVDEKTGALRRFNLWEYTAVELPENFASQPFQLKLELQIVGENAATGLYFDAVGIGTQKVAYGYEHGTSMATPAVTGSVALLAANNMNESADVLASRVKGGTTSNDNFKDISISGGHINVEKAQNNPNPVVYEAGQQGSAVTLKGHFLGSNGTIKIDGADAADAVTGWSEDAVTLDMSRLPVNKGWHSVVITADSRTGSSSVFFGVDKAVEQGFESLSLPEGASLEAMAEQNTATGRMAAAGGALYYFNGSYLAAFNGNGIHGEEDIVTKVWRYAPGESGGVWEQLPSPENLFMYDPAACAWQGKIYLMGTVMNKETGQPMKKMKLVCFNASENTWSTVCELPEGLPNAGALINYRDQLIYAGGLESGTGQPQDACYRIDPEKKTAELTDIKLPVPLSDPRLSVGGTSREIITLYDNAGAFYTTSDGKTWQKAAADYDGNGQNTVAALGGVSTGAIATGLVKNYNDPEKYRDTWTLNAGAEALAASDKVYYPAKTVTPVGIAYQNYFYVLSEVSRDMEPGGLVFRRVPVSTTDAAEGGGGGDTPSDQPGGHDADQTKKEKASVNTGIVADSRLSLVICVGLLALCAAGGLWVRKRGSRE